MDHRASLAAVRSSSHGGLRAPAHAALDVGSSSPDAPTTVQADQAIFTSIRGAMGEGYRLVAMSPSIAAEERAEITRRSPSHGSICDLDDATCALASYRLATGRHCVAWSRYAGKEHTARGGNRVHTHLVVLDTSGWRAFACDPFRVQAALAENIGPEPNIKPSVCLSVLTMRVEPPASVDAIEVDQDRLGRVCRLAEAMFGRATILATTRDRPLEVLRWAVAVLPQTYREDLTLSGNLHYASSRELRLTCLDSITPDARRAIQGHDIQVLDLTAVQPVPGTSPFAGWFKLVEDRWQQRRMDELCLLAGELSGQVDATCLDRVVAVVRDADRVQNGDQADLEQLVKRYANLEPPHPVERRLVRQLLSAAVRRSSALQHLAV